MSAEWFATIDSSIAQLDGWGLDDFDRGLRNVRSLAFSVGKERFGAMLPALAAILPRVADPDMALNNLERFCTVPNAGESIQALAAETRGLDVLLQIFSTSQFFSDLLNANPDFLEVVQGPLRPCPTRENLIDELTALIGSAGDDAGVLRVIRRFRQREHLRIGVNDIVRDRPLEEITLDLSTVAEAIVAVALETALHNVALRFGRPHLSSGEPSQMAVLAFGKLGAAELNYSSDIDLMIVYDDEGFTRGKRSSIGNDEFYARTVSELVRLLSAHTDRGQAYRVDLRLRPEGKSSPTARSLASTLAYYDTLGRTWERQALIKVRPIAGDRTLGEEFLRAIESFVWRTYLSFAEINEIKSMKRRIESHSSNAGSGERDVKTGRGGIRDVEFTIQFLQLLNGGDLPGVRQRGTLAAMQALESAGCLSDPEYRALDDAYRFLRKTEHRLQILFDWQTHRIPERPEELRKLALRMGYSGVEPQDSELQLPTANAERRQELMPPKADSRLPSAPQRHSLLDEPPIVPSLQTRDLLFDPLEQFLHDYLEKTELTRTILDHLLHQTFAGSDSAAEPESDLVLAPDPDEADVHSALGRYPFKDIRGAHLNLMQLAQEAGPFLSTRRCRHFLASIAPQLLRAVAETPNPDLTLTNLEKVTASLGAKAVLWELFSFLPASLKLYVDLCSNSPFLSEILINNPGMIDDLLDSLIMNRPRTLEELRTEIRELCRGVEKAEVIEPILRSYQDKELLRIGVRDLLAMDEVRATTASLSDLAEAILSEVAGRQEVAMKNRYGQPFLAEGPRIGLPCRHALLALGKLGGREMSYHSDLDLVFIYEGDGRSAPAGGTNALHIIERIDNYQFHTELAQRIIRGLSQSGPFGKLYAVDMRLRPTGKSGSLVIPIGEFHRYYEGGPAQIWERQSLTRARVVYGDPEFALEVMATVQQSVHIHPWRSEIIEEIRGMRGKLEATASPGSLKRGPGGLVDVEFLVQMFQMKYGNRFACVNTTNTWEALDRLREIDFLDETEHLTLITGYSFLRFAEARLRIVTNRPLTEHPATSADLEIFARRMGFHARDTTAAARYLIELQKRTEANRGLFSSLLERERGK